MTALLTGLVSLLVFGAVILVHELGHFLAARHCGIHVEEFSVGFGPKLLQRRRRNTLYTLRLFPLGGYNLFSALPEELDEGEESAAPVPPSPARPHRHSLFPVVVQDQPFEEATAWQRFYVTLCGALMNFVLGFVVLLVLGQFGSVGLAGNSYPGPLYLLAASLTGWMLVYEGAHLLARVPAVSGAFSALGRATMPIVILHFLAFKPVTWLGLLATGGESYLLAAFPIYFTGGAWWVAYTAAGLALPLLAYAVWVRLKKAVRRG